MLIKCMEEAGGYKGLVPTTQVLKFSRDSGSGGVEDEENVDLSLSLSLNGKFGVDPIKPQSMLIRSSSTSIFTLSGEENHARVVSGVSRAPLERTCSLPLETEELRKRKQLQGLRRMEAKRRRMDKLKPVKLGRDKVDLEENVLEGNDINTINGQSQDLVGINANSSIIQSQESIGSQCSGSSGLSGLERQSTGGNSSSRSSSNFKVHKEMKPAVASGTATGRAHLVTEPEESWGLPRNFMREMPCVSTIVKGPAGKRIEGFLYRYKKGEEVRIMCACHGSSHSPAEFVKHAGGGDVEHPLRHIVVSQSSLL